MPKLTITLDQDTWDLLSLRAQSEDRTPAQMARILLREATTEPQTSPQETQKTAGSATLIDNLIETTRDAIREMRQGAGPHKDRAVGVALNFIGREMGRKR